MLLGNLDTSSECSDHGTSSSSLGGERAKLRQKRVLQSNKTDFALASKNAAGLVICTAVARRREDCHHLAVLLDLKASLSNFVGTHEVTQSIMAQKVFESLCCEYMPRATRLIFAEAWRERESMCVCTRKSALL